MVINRQGHCVKTPLPFPPTSVWWADPAGFWAHERGPSQLSLPLFLPLLPFPLASSLFLSFIPFYSLFSFFPNLDSFFLSLAWLLFPVNPPEGRWFWDWNLGGEECKVCASSSSWNHVLHQSFSECENKGVPVANAKWALWFPSTFVPHVFDSLRRRGECRAGFGDT